MKKLQILSRRFNSKVYTTVQKKLVEQQQETNKQTNKKTSRMQTQLQDESKVLQTASKMQKDLLQQGKEIKSFLYTVSGFRPPFENF